MLFSFVIEAKKGVVIQPPPLHFGRVLFLAFGNGKTKSITISAVEKRRLITSMRAYDFPKQTFVFKVFAALIFLLLQDEQVDDWVIDKEYPGREGIVNDVLTHLFRKNQKPLPNISFAEIGKKSSAHKAAIDVFRGERKPDKIVKAKDIIEQLY